MHYSDYESFKACYRAMLTKFLTSPLDLPKRGQAWSSEQLNHIELAKTLGDMSDRNAEFVERYENELIAQI